MVDGTQPLPALGAVILDTEKQRRHKVTMHDQIEAFLQRTTSAEYPTTQPQITLALGFDASQGSRALVLNEIQERNPLIRKRPIEPHERKPEHGRAKFFWWSDVADVTSVKHDPNRKHPKRMWRSMKALERCIRMELKRGADAPLMTVDQLCEVVWNKSDKQISSALSRMMRTERHLERQNVDSGRVKSDGKRITVKGYRLNPDYKNPFLGAERLTVKGGKKQAARACPPEIPTDGFPPEGAEHTVADCVDKFDNVRNFSSTPLGQRADVISVDRFAEAVRTVNAFREQRPDAVVLEVIDGCLKARIEQRFE